MAAALLLGLLAAVRFKRLIDVVAVGMWKVAQFDNRQVLIESELIADGALAEPTTNNCLEGISSSKPLLCRLLASWSTTAKKGRSPA